MGLNDDASQLVDFAIANASRLRIGVERSLTGATLLDFGVHAAGGLEAGRLLAAICLASRGDVSFQHGLGSEWPGITVTVRTDDPIAACLASQYAGWQLSVGKFFAMGSGPMRAAAGREQLFDGIGHREKASRVVGILEASKSPPAEVIDKIASDCGVTPDNVTIAYARTASLAGTIQVVARALETALHKLHELKFDLKRVVSGFGIAPLPPIATNDLAAIGWTNDAVLYGAQVTLWVRGDDVSLVEEGPRIPASSSSDFGRPFADIFERYNRDFYRIDPLLFSPAVVSLVNLDTGRTHRFGHVRFDVLRQAWGVE